MVVTLQRTFNTQSAEAESTALNPSLPGLCVQ